jgi:hypothetical protein
MYNGNPYYPLKMVLFLVFWNAKELEKAERNIEN